MNSGDIIVNVKSMKDIDKITNNTRYINLSIDHVDDSVIDYFLLYGKDYSYSDTIDNKNGFIYASYDMFKDGEDVINKIIDNMPYNLNDIEKIRYIYISLGKILFTDINSIDSKNESISFDKISSVNNIWGSLSKRQVGEVITSKIFMYICSRLNIKCELVSSSIKGNIANKVYINDDFLIVDLYNDLCNIQGGFSTKYFDKYNDCKDIDKKIGYIRDEYANLYIDRKLQGIDYTSENVVEEILGTTSDVINVGNIGPYELYKIYINIFDIYIPNYDVKVNNLYIPDGINKQHFILFSYGNKHYSYNYNKGMFINVEEDILNDNISNNRIGIYDNEDFDFIEKRVLM